MTDITDNLDTIRDLLLDTGEWAYGDTPDDAALTAREWVLQGFTAEQVRGWLAARVWWPETARAIAKTGHTPDWAAVMSPDTEGTGCYADTPGYKLANGDLDLGKLAGVVA